MLARAKHGAQCGQDVLTLLCRIVAKQGGRACLSDLPKRWADEPLKVCLDLRGFYVKIGQVD